MINKTKKHIFHAAIITVAFSTLIPFTPMSNKVLPVKQVVETQAATLGENNALAKAKSYLEMMAFSKKELVNQLKFDGFTTKEAKYAVNNCKANWKKQATKKAKSYLETMPFSKKELIDQLKFDGFTTKQAKYGAKKAGF